MKVDVVVIGSGPAGYSAAFRAAELGLDVTLVDPRPKPGGTYLYETCIPSKSFLTQHKLLIETQKASAMGIHFQKPEVDVKQLNSWKDEIVGNIADSLLNRCSTYGVQLIQGKAVFEGSNTIRLKDSELTKLKYKHAVIATGASPVMFPGTSFDQSNRVMNPAQALNITNIPETILVVGGGSTGVEIGSIYTALGSTVDLAEQNTQILTDADEDLTAPLTLQLASLLKRLLLQTTVTEIIENNEYVTVEMQTPGGKESHSYDSVIIAIGQKCNSDELGLANTSVEPGNNGTIKTNVQQRTAEPNIFAVGDVTNNIMLAHTALRQGQVAAEVIAGQSSSFDIRAIPNIIYTSPQIAWCGLTESDAFIRDIPVIIKKYPWKHSARATILGESDGFTKIIVSKKDNRILGAGITGTGAEDLIAEWVLAIEMGALVEDIQLCLHGHPTLSEAL